MTIQLEILNGTTAGSVFDARRFPFMIGRAETSNLRFEGDGVWDRHVTLLMKRGEGFLLRAEPGALLSVNGQPTAESLLRNGDVIEMGSVRARFWLAPASQRGLGVRETLVWIGIIAVTAGQLAVIYWLG